MGARLWTAAAAAAATGGRLAGGQDWSAGGVSIDTRTLGAGDLFVALEGEARDGHEFLDKAFAAGAAAALVTRASGKGPELVVADTLEGLRALGAGARERCAGRRIGVTGSVGKTGTKELLRTALSRFGRTHAPEKSYNNHWGVPLTLARMPADTAFGVFEMGMNHPDEIRPLTTLVEPEIAIVTTVAPVHLEFFDSIAGIARAKAEIFDGLVPGGTAIVNHDNPYTSILVEAAEARGARVVSFGEGEGANVRLLAVATTADGMAIEADVAGRPVAYRLQLPGTHWAVNSLAVLAAVDALGLDVAAAADALAGLAPMAGRGARVTIAARSGAFDLVDESYNANPASMAAAIATLGAAAAQGRRVAVLGDMRELGPDGPALHASLAAAIAAARIDRVHLAGPLMRHLHDALPDEVRGAWAESSEALADAVMRDIEPGDLVMVKGSLGSAMKVIVDRLTALGNAADAVAGPRG